jgi:hypothetical protein
LPLAEVRSVLFGHSLVSLPFAAYGGVAADDADAIAALHAAALDLARSLRVAHLELRNRSRREPEWPQQSLYVTFRKELAPEVEANLLAIPRKQRAMVRKGVQRGLEAGDRPRRRTILRAVRGQRPAPWDARAAAPLLRSVVDDFRGATAKCRRSSMREGLPCRRC